MNKILFFIQICTWMITTYCHAQEAVITVPVADCFGEPLAEIDTHKPGTSYEHIPICAQGNAYACPRIHQLLFHQRVFVTEQVGAQVKITVPHLFFQLKGQKSPQQTFWTQKKYLMFIEDLKKKGININLIPPFIDALNKKFPEQTVVTLTSPHYDHKLKRTFSAGTRFITASKKNSITNYQDVYALNPHILSIQTITIPADKLIKTDTLSRKEKVNCFVKVLKQWAHMNEGFIPYVWGGSSVKRLCHHDTFSAIKDKNGNTFYKRIESHYPHTGLDCAGMIIAAAQTCGIPFYLKNSTTIVQNLKPLENHEKIEEGDIIWIPAHVMVVGDLKRQTIIEARHYNHGYGKVHEIHLNQVFKNVNTFETLKQMYLDKKPLERLNKEGEVAQIINQFFILKLNSVWPH